MCTGKGPRPPPTCLPEAHPLQPCGPSARCRSEPDPQADGVSASHLLATSLFTAQGTLRTFKVSSSSIFQRRRQEEREGVSRGLGVCKERRC